MRKVQTCPLKTLQQPSITSINNNNNNTYINTFNKVNDMNKKYFYIKNNYKEEIEELQDSFGLSFNFMEMFDTQHALIKELEDIVNELMEELSFKKLIICRKDRVLKDLNMKIVNRFIDKVYKQELEIEELKKKITTITKYNNNDVFNIQQQGSGSGNYYTKGNTVMSSGGSANSNINHYQQYHPVKNIERFINIKHNNSRGSEVQERTIQEDISFISKQSNRNNSNNYSLGNEHHYNNNTNCNTNRKVRNDNHSCEGTHNKRRNMSVEGVLSNNSIYNKTLGAYDYDNYNHNNSIKSILDLSFAIDRKHKRNRSNAYIDSNNNNINNSNSNNVYTDTNKQLSNSSIKKRNKQKPFQTSNELIGKSYEVVRRYQLKKKQDDFFQTLRKPK